MNFISEIDVDQNIIDEHLSGADFYDCYSIVLDDQDLNLEDAAKRVFTSSPKWISALLTLRNILVRPFGLQGALHKGKLEGDVIGFFPVVSRTENELVLGFDDKHLDFRVVVRKSKGHNKALSAATLVQRNNLFGKLYLFVVKPFHRFIVPTMLKQVNANG